jgi:hypothetical protein
MLTNYVKIPRVVYVYVNVVVVVVNVNANLMYKATVWPLRPVFNFP